MSRKFALIIGNSHYDDPHFDQLKTPDADVKGLAAVLRDPDIGGFDSVQEVINQPAGVVKRAISTFFYQRRMDDLLLLYFSGHGLTDNQRRLYLGVKDTPMN